MRTSPLRDRRTSLYTLDHRDSPLRPLHRRGRMGGKHGRPSGVGPLGSAGSNTCCRIRRSLLTTSKPYLYRNPARPQNLEYAYMCRMSTFYLRLGKRPFREQ
jgi:hypothetical protein